jgi:hypothetical protein
MCCSRLNPRWRTQLIYYSVYSQCFFNWSNTLSLLSCKAPEMAHIRVNVTHAYPFFNFVPPVSVAPKLTASRNHVPSPQDRSDRSAYKFIKFCEAPEMAQIPLNVTHACYCSPKVDGQSQPRPLLSESPTGSDRRPLTRKSFVQDCTWLMQRPAKIISSAFVIIVDIRAVKPFFDSFVSLAPH